VRCTGLLTLTCVQPLLQLHRRGGITAHCCSTDPQFHAPNTPVSAVHSVLAEVPSSGVCLCMRCTIITLCTGMKVGIRARHVLYLICLHARLYMTSHSVMCMGSRILSYARALIVLLPHTCAYSLQNNSIGAEGAQHIAAALAHNSTLQILT
jgi:hypothetical protein